MLYRRASSRVLGSFCPGFRSLLTMPRTICVASCSRSGTSLLFESQIRIDAEARVAACVLAGNDLVENRVRAKTQRSAKALHCDAGKCFTYQLMHRSIESTTCFDSR